MYGNFFWIEFGQPQWKILFCKYNGSVVVAVVLMVSMAWHSKYLIFMHNSTYKRYYYVQCTGPHQISCEMNGMTHAGAYIECVHS